MFDDFQSSIPWKTVACSHHAPEMTREEKRIKGRGREKSNIDQSCILIPRFEYSVFKFPFLRFGVIHIPLTQPGHLFSTLSLHHPLMQSLNSSSFKGVFQKISIVGTEKTPVLGHNLSCLQNGKLTCSIRVLILVISYFMSILTSTPYGREDIIKFILEIRIPNSQR